MTTPADWTSRFDDATSRILLVEGGSTIGRMEILFDLPYEIDLVHPRVLGEHDPVAVAGALVAAGVRRGESDGAGRIGLILEGRAPHYDAFVAAAPDWGFD